MLGGGEDGGGEHAEPGGLGGVEPVRADRVRVPVGSEPFNVLVAESRQDQADRQYRLGGEPASGEHGVDEGAADASVAVSERMDRFELGVREAGLDNGRVPTSVEVADEVIEQRRNVFRGGGDEVGVQGVVVGAADPVLHGADAAVLRLVGQQRGVQFKQVLDRHLWCCNKDGPGFVQDRHVVGDQLGLGGHVGDGLLGAEFGQGHLLDRRCDALDP